MSDRPWGATLSAIWRRQITGRLTVCQGEDSVVIAFRHGTIVGATSTVAADTDIGRRVARTFAFERATFEIDDEPPVATHPGIDLRAVIYFGARFVLTDARVIHDLRQFGTWFQLAPDAELGQFGIAPTDPAIERLRSGCSLTDLDRHARVVTYALACCGMCMIERTSSETLGVLASGTERMPTMITDRTPIPVAPRRASSPAFGVRDVTERSRVPTPTDGIPLPITPVPTTTRRRVLAQLHDRVTRGADHFALLGVPFDAPVEVVRSAYLVLARQLQVPPASAEQAPRVVAQLSTAFAILTDPVRRAAYIANLQPPADQPPSDGAREAAARGATALEAGDYAVAAEELGRAVELEPNRALYRAQLAWAEFCAAPDKQAIAEATRRVLAGAVAKSEDPVLPVYYLARVAKEVGRDREALRLFQRVLHLDPEHREARTEVRALTERTEKRGLLDRFRR